MSTLANPPTVIFAGNDLNQVPGLIINNRDIFTDGYRQINSQKLARTDKSILTTAEYSSKLITVSLSIVTNSRQQLEASHDTLNSLVQDIEGTLQITQNSVTRNYTATLHSSEVHYSNGGFLQKTLVFICSDPFGYDNSASLLFSDTVISVATSTISMVVGGSFKATPNLTLTVGSVTGGTAASVELTNSATGLGVTITRDWTAGDIITINGDTGIVYVNGIVFNPTGKLPFFVPGLRQLSYVDTFTTRSVTLSGTYTKKWL